MFDLNLIQNLFYGTGGSIPFAIDADHLVTALPHEEE
jgi:hypothetical protein